MWSLEPLIGNASVWHKYGGLAVQVFGGLIVGMVVKYADNILKNFANALSVIFTVVGAVPLFHQYPSGWFILGVAFVILSVCMYGKSTPAVRACTHTVSALTPEFCIGGWPMFKHVR